MINYWDQKLILWARESFLVCLVYAKGSDILNAGLSKSIKDINESLGFTICSLGSGGWGRGGLIVSQKNNNKLLI